MTNPTTSSPQAPTRAPKSRPAVSRPAAVLAIVLIGQFMAVIDVAVVNVAIPSLHADLGASGAGLQLIVAGYTITYAVLLVTGARLGDIFGHRRMFLAGIALFTLASLGCGLAPAAGFLIGLRFAQGAAAGLMIPQVLSLIQRTYPEAGPRARAMSMYAAIIAGGAVVGQILGGLLVTADIFGLTWRPVFLVNVPVGLAALAFGARLLPRSGSVPGRSLDLPGLFTLTPALLAFVLPLVLGQPLGWPSWGWALLAASAVLFASLAVVERRVGDRGGQPLLPRELFRLPGVPVGLGGLLATMTVFGGWSFAQALELQDALAESPLRAGLTFAPAALGFALVSLNWGRLPARAHSSMAICGFIVNGSALVLTGILLRSGGDGGAWLYVLGGLTGAGMAAAYSPLMTRTLSRVPVDLAADASGVVVTANQMGNVVGIATFGSLYLNLAGRLPARLSPAFTLVSAHAYLYTSVALAGLAAVGVMLAAAHLRASKVPG